MVAAPRRCANDPSVTLVAVGIIVPEDFSLRTLANDEERAVVEALRDRLSDDWLVIPDVGLVARSTGTTRSTSCSPTPARASPSSRSRGIGCSCATGSSCPTEAISRSSRTSRRVHNAYALRDLLRASGAGAVGAQGGVRRRVPEHDRRARRAAAGAASPAQFMTSTFLDDPADAVDRLMCLRWGGQDIGATGVAAVVRVLRPNAELDWTRGPRARRARRRMDELCEQRVRALEPLDANRRVLVTGGAGSGKTRLAMAWARRAVGRGERVLLTCYNDPLGDDLVERMPPQRPARRSARSSPSPGDWTGCRRSRCPPMPTGRGGTPSPSATCTATGRQITRALRHHHRRRGPGLQPGLAGPARAAARSQRPRRLMLARGRRPGRVPARLRSRHAR